MRILYVSVHSVLEFDEIRMFKGLGHEVFSLGVYFGGNASQPFRDQIIFSLEELALTEQFYRCGCSFSYGDLKSSDLVITAEFVRLFDIVIVMHDLDFVERFWGVLSQRPVVWRTIGQYIDPYETKAAWFRDAGMAIVRYSPAERRADHYAGETALIRFVKDEADFGPWNGAEERVLMFSNLFAQRFAHEAALYMSIVDGFPAVLGGAHNEGMPNAIGLLPASQQRALYNDSRLYLYCAGRGIPYTLNLMEAMMTGMPIVAMASTPDDRFYEAADLVAAAGGVVCVSADEARGQIAALLDDHTAAVAMAERARATAIDLFGIANISRQWQSLLDRVV